MMKFWIYSFVLLFVVGQALTTHHAVEHHTLQDLLVVSQPSTTEGNHPNEPVKHTKDCTLCHFAEQAFDTPKDNLDVLTSNVYTTYSFVLQTVSITANLPTWQSRAPPVLS